MVGHVCLMCWPICATMLGQTVTSQRFCRLLAPSAAQAVSNTFSRRCGTIRMTLVFERSGTGILLHAAEAGGGECSACSNPATDSVPLVLTIKLNGPMLAERTTLSMLPTITWEQGTSCRQSTVPSMPGNCSARRSRSASFVRQRLNCSAGAAISDAVGGPFMLGYAHAVLSFSHPCTDA